MSNKPRQRLRRAVGVQRAQHQMPRQRRFNPRVRRLRIAHLPHHDDVRVGPQKRPHGRRKGEPDARVHLHLPQAILGDLHRVFRRPDFQVRRVDRPQRRVQRRRLARPRRPHHQEQPVGLLDQAPHLAQIALGHLQGRQRQRLTGRQQPQHHVFIALRRRNRRHPQLDLASLRQPQCGSCRLAVCGARQCRGAP